MEQKLFDLGEFPKQFGFIVYFLVLALLIVVFFKEKVLFYFLLLILAGMVLLNSDKISRLIYQYIPR